MVQRLKVLTIKIYKHAQFITTQKEFETMILLFKKYHNYLNTSWDTIAFNSASFKVLRCQRWGLLLYLSFKTNQVNCNSRT